MDTNLVKCPHCAELIQPDAKVCRYCGRDVDPKVIQAQAWQKIGKSMQSTGCLLTIFVSLPICLCLAFLLLGQ